MSRYRFGPAVFALVFALVLLLLDLGDLVGILVGRRRRFHIDGVDGADTFHERAQRRMQPARRTVASTTSQRLIQQSRLF